MNWGIVFAVGIGGFLGLYRDLLSLHLSKSLAGLHFHSGH